MPLSAQAFGVASFLGARLCFCNLAGRSLQCTMIGLLRAVQAPTSLWLIPKRGRSGVSDYSVTKTTKVSHGVSLTKALAKSGVTSNVISPGATFSCM
jgi:NAD(P)-dependent dehydrogenase (short-subunit alcohol dehydrogenase family)